MGNSSSRRDRGTETSAPSASEAKSPDLSQQGRKNSVSAGVSKFVLDSFAAIGNVRTLSDGMELVRAGETPSQIWAIMSGVVDLEIQGEDGKRIKLTQRGEGDVIGLLRPSPRRGFAALRQQRRFATGELSLLLAHKSAVTVIAKGSVNVIEVRIALLPPAGAPPRISLAKSPLKVSSGGADRAARDALWPAYEGGAALQGRPFLSAQHLVAISRVHRHLIAHPLHVSDRHSGRSAPFWERGPGHRGHSSAPTGVGHARLADSR